jgi:hypothetical protein
MQAFVGLRFAPRQARAIALVEIPVVNSPDEVITMHPPVPPRRSTSSSEACTDSPSSMPASSDHAIRCAKPLTRNVSPAPVADTATPDGCASRPAPGIGESPTRPGHCPARPPVEVAAATRPAASTATAPTVPSSESRERPLGTDGPGSAPGGASSACGTPRNHSRRIASSPCDSQNRSAPAPASRTGPSGRPPRSASSRAARMGLAG